MFWEGRLAWLSETSICCERTDLALLGVCLDVVPICHQRKRIRALILCAVDLNEKFFRLIYVLVRHGDYFTVCELLQRFPIGTFDECVFIQIHKR